MSIKAPKGTKDITILDSFKWHYIEGIIHREAAKYGFRETRTPVFESTELFLRGVGDTTDIVQKEMYTFDDKGGRSMTLKPEGTAGAVRSFIENNLYAGAQPTKMYYLNCPVFVMSARRQGVYVSIISSASKYSVRVRRRSMRKSSVWPKICWIHWRFRVLR